ncbi:hypothetical protein [Hyphomicrobium sp. DY-1]|uniref:hypothetical protein n=1 Tax=Hyphomicrobium sp. DY-1 TaxID=3075650 RepID=UPI0039C2B2FC
MTTDTRTYSVLDVEAALIIWECFDDWSRDETFHPEVAKYRADFGTVELRHLAIALAPHCLAVHRRLPASLLDGLAYDWDVIPAILENLDWRKFPDGQQDLAHAVTLARAALIELRDKERAAQKPLDTVPADAGAPVMPPTTMPSRALPFRLFDKRFAPIPAKGHDICRDPSTLPRQPLERHWWTVQDNGGPRWSIRPGIHVANRMFLIHCRNPWGGNADDHPTYAY